MKQLGISSDELAAKRLPASDETGGFCKRISPFGSRHFHNSVGRVGPPKPVP